MSSALVDSSSLLACVQNNDPRLVQLDLRGELGVLFGALVDDLTS
jgi:hypothetical protein